MKEKNGLLQKIVGAVGIALCVVFVPLLLINVTLIVKSYTSPDKVPDFLGYKPFIVLSGSMEPSIMTGDMVFVKETDPDSLKVGDVIEVREKSRSSVKFKGLLGEDAPMVTLPKWLTRDKNTLQGTVAAMPARDDIDFPVEEHLIVELYSK